MGTNHTETLQDLARLAFDRNGGGGRVQQAKLAGTNFSMVRTTFDQILAGTYGHRPSRKTLEALAYLAGVPAERAMQAAGRKYAAATFADMLPPDVDDLNDDQRRAVIDVARAFLKTNKEMEGLRHDLEQQQPPKPLPFPSGEAVEDDPGAGQKSVPDFLGMAADTNPGVSDENDAREAEWDERGEENQDPGQD